MDPYRILRLPPTATLEEAEAAYRRLLKQEHPDRHLQHGPEVVARAEQRTRELNAAIGLLRMRGDDPWLRPDPEAAAYRDSRGGGAAPGQASTGADDPGSGPDAAAVLSCPWCPQEFADPARLVAHTASMHPRSVARAEGFDVERPSWVTLLGVPLWGLGVMLLVVLVYRPSQMTAESVVLKIAALWLVALPLLYQLLRRHRLRQRDSLYGE